jgi:hypothetical protein
MTPVILSALLSLPVYKEDVNDDRKHAQLKMIAEAIAQVSSESKWPNRKQHAALLIAIAYHETGLSLRIHAGNCKPYECDGGRARGLWQLHSNAYVPPPIWYELAGLDFGRTRASALEASRALNRAYWMCARHDGDKVAMALTAYAGLGCRATWKGLKPRLQTYASVLRKLGG